MAIIVNKKNIHNKLVFDHIDFTVRMATTVLNVFVLQEAFIDFVESVLDDLASEHDLVQTRIICTTPAWGITHVDIYYKHKNHFNTTHLSYVINEEPVNV